MFPAAPSSTVTTRVAVLFSSSRSWLTIRIVLAEALIRASSHCLPGTSRKLSGSSSSSTASGPASRYSSTRRFCSPPDRVARSRYLTASYDDTERRRAAHVPDHLDVVAARVGELREGRGVAHLGALVVGVHQQPLAALDLGRRRTYPVRSDGEQQVGHRLDARTADHLTHHPETAAARHSALVRGQVAADDPQQGGLARPVGADQRHLGALPHPERHLVEQDPPVRQLVAHTGDVDVTHAHHCRRTSPGCRTRMSTSRRPRALESGASRGLLGSTGPGRAGRVRAPTTRRGEPRNQPSDARPHSSPRS